MVLDGPSNPAKYCDGDALFLFLRDVLFLLLRVVLRVAPEIGPGFSPDIKVRQNSGFEAPGNLAAPYPIKCCGASSIECIPAAEE